MLSSRIWNNRSSGKRVSDGTEFDVVCHHLVWIFHTAYVCLIDMFVSVVMVGCPNQDSVYRTGQSISAISRDSVQKTSKFSPFALQHSMPQRIILSFHVHLHWNPCLLCHCVSVNLFICSSTALSTEVSVSVFVVLYL